MKILQINLTKIKKNPQIKIIKNLFISQKNSWKIYPWTLLYTLLPAIWILFRAFLINNISKANIDTYIQWEYFSVFLEILQQTILFSLFWWFGKINLKKSEDVNKIREAYLFAFIIYCLVLFIVSFLINSFLNFINPLTKVNQQAFFLLQLWSNLPIILQQISIVIFLNSKMYKGFAFFLIIKVSLGIIFDFTLANQSVFSNAYLGLGISTFLTESLLFLASFLFIVWKIGFKKFFVWEFINKTESNRKKYFSNILAAFIYSCISNIFYLMMISRNLNISSTGNEYWLSNTIIWNWILLFPISLLTVNKSLLSINKEENLLYKKQIIKQFQIMTLFALLFSLSIFAPLYNQLAFFLSGDQELTEKSFQIFLLVMGSYLFYISSESLNGYFISMGKNWTLVLNALIVNLTTWIPFIILNATNNILMNAFVIGVAWNLNQMISFVTNWFLISLSLKDEKIAENQLLVNSKIG